MRKLSEAGLAEVEQCFENVNDEHAMAKPELQEWSALEVAFHLIHGERFNQIFLTGLIDSYGSVADGLGTKADAQVVATVKANPSVALMLSALRCTWKRLLPMLLYSQMNLSQTKAVTIALASGYSHPTSIRRGIHNRSMRHYRLRTGHKNRSPS